MIALIIFAGTRERLVRLSAGSPDAVFVHPASRVVARGGRTAALSGLEFLLFVKATAGGQSVTHDDLIDAMWGQRPDGGPEWARNIINMLAWRLRAKIAPLGLTVYSPVYRVYCCAEIQACGQAAA